MKSRIWRLAAVGLLCASITGQVLADERGDGNSQETRPNGEQHRQEGGNQPHEERAQARPEGGPQRPENRPPESRPPENRPPQAVQPHPENRPAPGIQFHPEVKAPPANPALQEHFEVRPGQPHPVPPGSNLPIQPRPNAVQQTQVPNRGGNQNWQAGGQNARPGGNNFHPNDVRWAGRPDGHGNGWGPGPQYRPGYVIDRFQGEYHQVPYHGQNFFFSAGYWYRPQGPRYVVVQPPYGIRVTVIPNYAREVWVGNSLFFVAAGAYYTYQPATQDYIVVEPPVTIVQPAPQPVSNGYDVVAYPMNGQTPAQINQDRYDCYRWAVDQSHFDPAHAAYAPAQSVVQTYRQAEGNCLNSRGYQVTY
ncbi:glycine zipper family protein [Pseudomonas sp. 7P_10.2_Bac1]|uniref:DUF6515 family protein n=1 Tax=Pseudomonas sp. 7P_10.2_Bac1 TaxID=2971614 RepID=UPI0021C78B07|nr:DUF6515 family protein [Pseudomonas sp. 7P_10.2_Bac1]MCU1727746.1 glycine zipper family protein [Pseudomonas sp. 7P_10.2_Bac1]